MSKKRIAETNLNHDNWDEEEEPETIGVFQKASEEQMSGRKIVTARRRNPTSTSNNIFTSFKGFSNTPSIQPTPGTFDFLKSISKPPSSGSDETSKPETTAASGSSSFSQSATTTTTTAAVAAKSSENKSSTVQHAKRIRCDETTTPAAKDEKPDTAENSEAQLRFYSKVENLNIKFLKFLHDKIKSNPCIILNPPFQDYRNYIEKYLKEKIEDEHKFKLEKEKGYNFQSLPNIGQSGSLTLKNNETNEVKTFTIGGTKTKDETEDLDQKSEKEVETTNKSFLSKDNKAETLQINKKNDTSNSLFKFSQNSTSTSKSLIDPPKQNDSSKNNFSFGLSTSPTSKDNSTKNEFTSMNKKSFFSTSNSNETSKTNLFFNTTKKQDSDSQNDNNKLSNFSFDVSKSPFVNSKQDNVLSSSNPLLSKNDLSKLNNEGTSNASFGLGKCQPQTTFSFGLNSTSSFTSNVTSILSTNSGNTTTATATTNGLVNGNNEDDDDVLPKEEIKEVIEKDSIFTIRCKIFVKKSDGEYGDRGVGNLFVKCIEDNVKCQIIVRAAIDSGKIIFNVLISKNVPIKLDKNNLIIICVPHPTTEQKPVPCTCVVKVKTKQDAENLLNCLEKFKQ